MEQEIILAAETTEETIDLLLESDDEEIVSLKQEGGDGTSDYEGLFNKPKINNVELVKNKTLEELGIQEKGSYPSESLTNTEIENLLNSFV